MTSILVFLAATLPAADADPWDSRWQTLLANFGWTNEALGVSEEVRRLQANFAPYTDDIMGSSGRLTKWLRALPGGSDALVDALEAADEEEAEGLESSCRRLRDVLIQFRFAVERLVSRSEALFIDVFSDHVKSLFRILFEELQRHGVHGRDLPERCLTLMHALQLRRQHRLRQAYAGDSALSGLGGVDGEALDFGTPEALGRKFLRFRATETRAVKRFIANPDGTRSVVYEKAMLGE